MESALHHSTSRQDMSTVSGNLETNIKFNTVERVDIRPPATNSEYTNSASINCRCQFIRKNEDDWIGCAVIQPSKSRNDDHILLMLHSNTYCSHRIQKVKNQHCDYYEIDSGSSK
ncbi:hypothetical protein AB6A40_008212 [Gnathostoma spinigerum]|uniref:Uncharacterized protein n=1 Tax=Gnathostoma spinigerum TaxID=75299 RepID=A0ABD6ENF6_9BILA